MKYLKLFESFEDINEVVKSHIDEICKQYGIKNYTINKDGSIDVDHNVYLFDKNLIKLPLKFNNVNGYFYCSNNQLTSFEYAPKIIRGDFGCGYNNIKSFEYFPSYVKGCFWCYSNPIDEVWGLFGDLTKIELLNDFDIFRDEDTDKPAIVMDRLNDFLLTIGKKPVKKVEGYKNI